jgi:hypothetical protein
MGKLLAKIRQAVRDGRYIVAWHADERCEERAITDWQTMRSLFESARRVNQIHQS